MFFTRSLFYSALVLSLSIISLPLKAQDSDIHKAINLGRARKDLDITDRQQREADARFNVLTISLNAAMDNYFLSAATELPLGIDNPNQTGVVEWVQSEQHSLTLGYNPIRSFSVFGGYVYSRYILRSGLVENIDKGPFLGAGYSLPIGEKNNLSLNVAYGALDGAITISSGSSNNANGDTTGFSYGLTYTGAYNNDLGYFLTLKINDYEFEQDTTPPLPRTKFATRKFTTFSAGLTF
jgi:hypothetical protein